MAQAKQLFEDLRDYIPPGGWDKLDNLTEMVVDESRYTWRLRPGHSVRHRGIEYHINSRGMRGPELDESHSLRRIVLLGPSIVFGICNHFQDSMGELLRHDFKRHTSEDVEVINAGVPGHSAEQGLERLDREILPLQPDVLFVSFGINGAALRPFDDSHAWAVALGTEPAEPEPEPKPLWSRLVGKVTNNTLAHRAVSPDARATMAALAGKATHAPVLVPRISRSQYVEAMTAIVEKTRGALPKTRVVVMAENACGGPSFAREETSQLRRQRLNALGRYRTALEELAGELDVELADTFGAFEQKGDDLGKYLLWDGVHPNKEGQRLYADVLFRLLSDGGR